MKMTVTPQMAEEMLKSNRRNRTINTQHVRYLAGEMVEGRWVDTGDAIKFSPTGALLDGQHRLLAIVQGGVPVALRVIEGIAEEAQLVMDSGKPRGTRHNLAMLGMENSTAMAAVGRALVAAEAIADGSNISGKSVSTTAVLEAFERWGLDRVKSITGRVRAAPPGVAVAGVEAAAVFADCLDVSQLFVDCMVSGDGPGVFRRLREQLLRSIGRRGGGGTALVLSMSVSARAVRAFVEGEEMSLLRPRPEEVKWLVDSARQRLGVGKGKRS